MLTAIQLVSKRPTCKLNTDGVLIKTTTFAVFLRIRCMQTIRRDFLGVEDVVYIPKHGMFETTCLSRIWECHQLRKGHAHERHVETNGTCRTTTVVFYIPFVPQCMQTVIARFYWSKNSLRVLKTNT